MALSFDALDGRRFGLEVTPPLLGGEVAALEPRSEDFLLCYALNAGSAERVVGWQRDHPDVTLHCFVDGGASTVSSDEANCHVHGLDRERFLDHLARCRAYVGTAGFESLCEAHYLGKPTLAVPTPGQLEQRLNAFDAERCGVARAGSFDDLGDFWSSAEAPAAADVSRFRSWVDQGPRSVASIVEAAAGWAA